MTDDDAHNELGARDLTLLDALLREDALRGDPDATSMLSSSASRFESGEARQEGIRRIVRSRGIRRVVHFTRVSNLPGILQHGLQPRFLLEGDGKPFAANDDLRLDGHPDSSSLSLTSPNYKMFYKYRKADESVKWCVLSYSANVLWELDCAFCVRNAASASVRTLPLKALGAPEALEALFSDMHAPRGNRATLQLDPDEPTDPQAEVLVFSVIPVARLQAVYVKCLSDIEDALWDHHPSLRFIENDLLFSQRHDWPWWTASKGEAPVVLHPGGAA